MQCMHHLRAASGERSTLHVGLAATTPLFEEETYRKVCRMGRDAPFSAKMNHAHLHQGAILDHPSCHVPMALFLQVSSSLAPMQVCWRMLHCPAAKPRVATGQGREVFFPRHRCSVERTEGLMFLSVWLYLFIYIVIVLYAYISIQVLYCLSIVLSDILGILSLRELSFLQAPYYDQNNSCCGIPIFHELSYCLFLISWQCATDLRSFLPISLMTVSAKSYLYIQTFFKSW